MAFVRSIRLRGFKTFARPTELGFEPGVTVIIGPNGSGKSNIADGVLWALGEQSPSTLRGRSMQDVIFAGSDGQRAGGLAEVTLVFENTSGMFPLDFAEVELTRRLLRDGSSEYRLNGSPCRLLDIQELAAGVGLGREMHSVISQGKVDELVNSTPQTRRALVEEAAGLGVYKKRRDRAQSKLEKVRTNLDRVAAVEREVRSALRPLKLQVTAAERFADATEDAACLRAQLALLEISELRARSIVMEADGRAAALRRAALEATLEGLRQERAREEDEFTAALQERERLTALYHRSRAEVDRVRGRASSLQQRRFRVDGDAARVGRRLEQIEEELSAVTARLVSLGDGPGHAGRRLERVQVMAQAIGDSLGALRPRLEAETRDEEDLREQVFELEAARSRLIQEREFLQKQVDEQSKRAEDLASREEEAARTVAELECAVQVAAEALGEAERKKSERAEESARVVNELEQAKEAFEQARTAERNAEEEAAALETRISVLDDVCSRREGVPDAAREILGRAADSALVADVVRVQRGFERAVAAALGPLASAVVVRTGRDLALLDRGGPVEIIWPGEGPVRVADPPPPAGGKGLVGLWDVLDGPADVLAALRSLLPPTYIAPAEGAVETSVGDASRLVTRDGRVLHGTLHGARRGEAGAQALLSARSELSDLTTRRAESVARLETARASVGDARSALAEAEERARECEAEAREAAQEAAVASGRLEALRRKSGDEQIRRSELRERREHDARAVEDLSGDLHRVTDTLAETGRESERTRLEMRVVRDRSETMRRDLSHLERKRAQASLVEVRLKERLRAYNEERGWAETQRVNLERDAAQARRQSRALAALMPILGELEEVTQELAEVAARQVAELGTQVEQSRQAGEGFGEALKELGRREADVQKELTDEAGRAVEIEVALARLVDRMDERERELGELRKRHLAPRQLTAEHVAGRSADDIEAELARVQRRLESMGPVNPLAEQEYRETEERAAFLSEQRGDLDASLSELKDVIGDLEQHIETTFGDIFEAARGHFSDMVQILFPGGKGMLRLEEEPSGRPAAAEDDDGETVTPLPGIVLEIKPPKKAPRSMSLLSGGEKALAAIAFLFALFLARPCPFYVLDEVEAALDDVNLGRFLSLVRRYQDQTQFIIITHQRRTMEIADTLYGVAMDADGTSRVLSRRLTHDAPDPAADEALVE